jgi:hypothetical protein
MAKGYQGSKARTTSADLETRLHGYVAILSAGAKNVRRRTGNWPIYAAATGSALAMATGASASLITSGIVSGVYPDNVSVKPLPGGASSIKGLVMSSGHEVNILAASGGTFAVLELQPIGQINIFFTGASSARDFAFKSNIGGPHAAPQAEIVKGFFSGNFHGQFQSGKPGFAGLSISTAGHTNKEYGWIELVFSENAGLPDDLRALAFGIDTNLNQTIQAGQINGGYIPEPGTMSLAILAAGALGVMSLRRRRQQA